MSPVSLPPNFFVVAQLFHLPSSASLWPPRQLKHLYTFLTPFQDSLFEPSVLLFPLSVFSPRISAKWHTKEKKRKENHDFAHKNLSPFTHLIFTSTLSRRSFAAPLYTSNKIFISFWLSSDFLSRFSKNKNR